MEEKLLDLEKAFDAVLEGFYDQSDEQDPQEDNQLPHNIHVSGSNNIVNISGGNQMTTIKPNKRRKRKTSKKQ